MNDRQPPILWSETTATETPDGIVVRFPVELPAEQYVDAFNRLRRRTWTPADEQREWWPRYSEDEPTNSRATRFLEVVVDLPSKELNQWLASNLPDIAQDVTEAVRTYSLENVARWIDDYELDKPWRWGRY